MSQDTRERLREMFLQRTLALPPDLRDEALAYQLALPEEERTIPTDWTWDDLPDGDFDPDKDEE